jgi:uncharacterized membrane protein
MGLPVAMKELSGRSILTPSVGISALAELFGLEQAILFDGSYPYHGGLEPRIAGSLPLAIPLAWFVLSWVPLTLLRP